MKKIIILITSVALLSACNQEKNNEFEFNCETYDGIKFTEVVNAKTEEKARELLPKHKECKLVRKKDLSFKNRF